MGALDLRDSARRASPTLTVTRKRGPAPGAARRRQRGPTRPATDPPRQMRARLRCEREFSKEVANPRDAADLPHHGYRSFSRCCQAYSNR